VKPAPGSAIRDRTPLIAATVSDADTELAQSNMRLFVDGRARAFSHNAADTDRLSRLSNRLAYGTHTVRIEATDGELRASKSWNFRIVR
jgi:hypothetical protein